MVTHEEFAKFILRLNPQNSASRLALYNYTKNFLDLSATFTADTLDRFYRSCLVHEYWRREAKELAHETQNLFQKFCEEYQLPYQILHPVDKMQVIKVENEKDIQDVCQNFLSRHNLLKTTTMIHDGDQIILVQLLRENNIKVHVFENSFLIRNGFIEPLCYDQNVIYNSGLEMESETAHNIKIMPQILAQFKYSQNRIEVNYIQGPYFKKIRAHIFDKLIDDKQLYFTLKKLERHFVDRNSDPIYLETVSKLEEALYLLEAHGEKAYEFALKALEIGNNYYKHAFPDDKMLGQLLNDLRFYLKGNKWKPSVSINLLHKAEM